MYVVTAIHNANTIKLLLNKCNSSLQLKTLPFNSSFSSKSLLAKASTIANAPSLLISSKERLSSFKLFNALRKHSAKAFAPSVLTRQSPKLMTSRFFKFGKTCQKNQLVYNSKKICNTHMRNMSEWLLFWIRTMVNVKQSTLKCQSSVFEQGTTAVVTVTGLWIEQSTLEPQPYHSRAWHVTLRLWTKQSMFERCPYHS